jgi:murein DD-endopeptidase MepM/ murein hydrolase activator NlpD
MANTISKVGVTENLLKLFGQTSTDSKKFNAGNLGISSKNVVDTSTRLAQLVNTNPPAGNGFRTVNLDDFLSVQRGSNAPVAIIVGNAEGTRTPSGGKTKLYYGHTDPGDKKPNIGSFSYNASRGLGNATTPEAADKVELKGLNSARTNYESKVRAAGLDPNNSLLASTFFDEHIQSPRSAGRLLRPDVLKYIKENGISPETMKEARFKSWINPETGNLYRTAKGNYEAGGFRTIAKDRLGISNPTEAQIQKVVRQDQNRRVGELVNALNKQGYGDGTAPTGGTTGTTPSETKPVSTSLKFGQKSEEVRAFQNDLVKLGLLKQSDVDAGGGNFGNRTKAAVESLQRNAGIEVDGKVGNDTKKAMQAILNGVRPGDTENAGLVKNVQNKLVELGYMTKDQIGNNGGVFGNQTKAALQAFQADNDIPSTGNIGKMTFNALFNGTPKANPNTQSNQVATGETQRVETKPANVSQTQLLNPVTGTPGYRDDVASENTTGNVRNDAAGGGRFRDPRGERGQHNALDIYGKVGTPLYAAHGGTVTIKYDKLSGHQVWIKNAKTGVSTTYSHLNGASNLKDGQTIRAGQPIGELGRSGNPPKNSKPHVHFKMRINGKITDPTPYLKGRKQLPTG